MAHNARGQAEYVTCPECEGEGKVWAVFVYRDGDSTAVRADCPYCGGARTVLESAVARDSR